MGNTWAADRRDKEPHTWMRHHRGASVKTVIPCMSGCHMSPWVDFNRSMERDGAASLLGETFSTSEWPPPPLHSHFFACETPWMSVRGVGLRTDGEGSQEKTAVPRVYTSTPPRTQHPPLPPSFPSISYRPGRFTVSCIWVWQQQPSCVWRAQQQRPANSQGGFSFFAVDLGLALHTSRRPASVRHGAPHCWGSATLTRKVFFLFAFFFFSLSTDTRFPPRIKNKLGLWSPQSL